VDAADYVVWRKSDGSPQGYNLWRTNFGAMGAGSGGGNGAVFNAAAVPEPSTVALATLVLIGSAMMQLRSRS
jgi:Zn-dependent alcohol dehydrogenase